MFFLAEIRSKITALQSPVLVVDFHQINTVMRSAKPIGNQLQFYNFLSCSFTG